MTTKKRTRKAAVKPGNRVLVLKVIGADGKSSNGFEWPQSGSVAAHDWDPEPVCGGGLHGWLWGEGRVEGNLPSYLSSLDGQICHPSTRWIVVSVDPATLVDLGGKVKFPACEVVHNGDRASATAYLLANGAAGRAIIGGTATAGDSGTATAGDRGTATAGDSGTATAGDSGTATAGDSGTATAGNSGTATAGDSGTATAGNSGTATAGNSGTATAGDRGTATAGDRGTATAGDRGTATAGDRGTATAGNSGIIQIRRYDYAAERWRLVTGYVGEDGIEACVAYRLSDDGKFERAVEGGAK